MIEWFDLLGRPFLQHGEGSSGMDCTTVAEEVWRRMGKRAPVTSPFRAAPEEVTGLEIGNYLQEMESNFKKLGDKAQDAVELGDVVLGYDDRGNATRLYTLVEPSTGTFLTASHQCGVRASRRFALGRVAGVYRLV